MTTDPIADLLTRIRNAAKARHPRVDLPASKLKLEIARILKEEGYLANYKVVDEKGKKTLRVFLPQCDYRPAARVAARLAALCRKIRDSPRGRRHGDFDSLHAARRDDRTIRPQGRPGRRIVVRGLVGVSGNEV